MSENKDKLEILREQVQTAAELDAKRILEQAEKQARDILADESARIEKKSGAAALAEGARFEAEIRKRVAQSRFNADRKVLTHRNALADELFGEIEGELRAFCASEKYAAYLSECAKQADGVNKLSEAEVFCRAADSGRVGAALAKYGVSPKTDRNILIGGMIVKFPKKGIFIDMTLDSALSAEREAFSANAGMQL